MVEKSVVFVGDALHGGFETAVGRHAAGDDQVAATQLLDRPLHLVSQ